MSRYRYELDRLYQFADSLSDICQVKLEGEVDCIQQKLPLFSFAFGDPSPRAPCLALFAGVHGLEVIGIQVLFSFMETLSQLMRWDQSIKRQLQGIQVLIYPCANPGGVILGRRSNPNGVDLMRNAPIEAEGVSRLFLGAGHRLSSRLPWYRGRPEQMEAESKILIDFCQRELFSREFVLALDMHSGFGMRDRIWFPFAHNSKPFPLLAEVVAFKELLDQTLPHHIYRLEPQCLHYLAHGDLWDYMFLLHQHQVTGNIFLPLCLELGSWRWLRKNPKQIFSSIGFFHPIMEHRKNRVLRHHYPLFDFLVRSVASWRHWFEMNDRERMRRQWRGLNDWYSQQSPKSHSAPLPSSESSSVAASESGPRSHLQLLPQSPQQQAKQSHERSRPSSTN